MSNTLAKPIGETAILQMGGATGGAVSGAGLRRLIELWPSLNDDTRQRILAIASEQERAILNSQRLGN